MSRTIHTIDLKKYKSNINKIKKSLPNDTQICAVIKADGYGQGATQLLPYAIQAGCSYCAVATAEEALELSKTNTKIPILLLAEPAINSIPTLVTHDIHFTIYTKNIIEIINQEAQKQTKQAYIHLKVDTGMNRLGITQEQLSEFLSIVDNLSNCTLKGVMTHFADAEKPESNKNSQQLNQFKTIKDSIPSSDNLLFHCANSAATLAIKESHFNLVRLGIAPLEDIASFKIRIHSIKSLKKGEQVSYDSTYTAPKDTQIAILEAGYADGIPSTLSNKGHVLIKDQAYPIIGKVCMDMTTVDIGDTTTIQAGDYATFLGKDKEQSISLKQIAQESGLNPRELLINLGKRAQRRYQ